MYKLSTIEFLTKKNKRNKQTKKKLQLIFSFYVDNKVLENTQ